LVLPSSLSRPLRPLSPPLFVCPSQIAVTNKPHHFSRTAKLNTNNKHSSAAHIESYEFQHARYHTTHRQQRHVPPLCLRIREKCVFLPTPQCWVMTLTMMCREVRTGVEERTRTTTRSENWFSRRMDKVRVCTCRRHKGPTTDFGHHRIRAGRQDVG
jgi:hypothetical protein